MNPLMPSLLLVFSTVLTGWAALWPARSRMGPAIYHACALPIGLLGWTFVTAVSVVAGSYSIPTVLAGLLLFVAGMRAVLALTTDGAAEKDAPRTHPLKGFLLAGGCYLIAAATLSLAGVTATTADSWKGYWPLGVLIESHATFTPYLPSARGFMLPSLSAASVFFGNEWEYVTYPLLALCLLVALVSTLVRSDLAVLPRGLAMAIAGGAALFALTDPSFIHHALYVHSHFMSAAYLCLALVGIRLSFEPSTGRAATGASAWLTLAGASTAGLAMTRPDGLAYAFVPIALVVAVLSDSRREDSRPWPFHAPLLLILGLPFAASYVEVGVWEATKLNGVAAAVIYLVIASTALIPGAVRRVLSSSRRGVTSETLVLGAVLAGLALAVVAAILRWDVMSLALMNARVNIFRPGGAWGLLWPALTAVLTLSVISGDAWRRGRWSAHLAGAIALFFLCALLVHGTSHPGRIGTGDSFNRVAFHIVPVIVWYVAIVAGRITGSLSARASAGTGRARAQDR